MSGRAGNPFHQALVALHTAIDHDDNRQYRQAQIHYLTMLERSVEYLKQTQWTSGGGGAGNNSNAQNEARLLEYMKQTLDRLSFIRGLDHQMVHLKHKKDTSSVATTTTAPITTTTTTTTATNVITAASTSNRSPTAASTVGRSPNSPSYARQTPHLVSRPESNALQRLRKQHEEQQLQLMREQMQRQLAERQRLLEQERQRREASSVVRKMRARNNQFRWRSRDRWTQFIDEYFRYEHMDPALILADQNWIQTLMNPRQRLMQGMVSELSTMKPTMEGTCTDGQRADKHDVAESDEIMQSIRSHLCSILEYEDALLLTRQTHGSRHALSQIISMFVFEFSKSYCIDKSGGRVLEEGGDLRITVGNALMEISAFTDKLLSVLLMKYWHCEAIDSEMGEDIILQEITRSIYSQGVHDILLALYDSIEEIKSQNHTLFSKCRKFNTNKITMRHLGIVRKFRLDDSENTYAPVVQLLRRLEHTYTAADKLALLSRCVNMISDSVLQYWRNSNEYTQEELMLAPDDLLPLFSYVMIRAEMVRPVSHFTLIGDLLEDFMGQEAFALATADTSWRYILTLEWDDLLHQFHNADKEHKQQR